jgi:hypothetical protein
VEGPYLLNDENVDALSSSPGVYIIGYRRDEKDYGTYVGRSDDDLKGRLRQHLPRNETNRCIKSLNCDRFWCEYADTARAPYERECTIYHQYSHNGKPGYVCNDVHPAKSDNAWKCPKCGA